MRNAMQVETRRRGSAPDPGKDLVGKAEARGKKAESPVYTERYRDAERERHTQ